MERMESILGAVDVEPIVLTGDFGLSGFAADESLENVQSAVLRP